LKARTQLFFIFHNFVIFQTVLITMNLDTTFLTFIIASLTVCVTLLTIYSSFGPGSENLIDPFEEDDD